MTIPCRSVGGDLFDYSIQDGTLSGKMAKEVFEAMWSSGEAADAIIEQRGLKQISDAGAIEGLVDQVLASNAKQVEDFRAGKENLRRHCLAPHLVTAALKRANACRSNTAHEQAVRLTVDGMSWSATDQWPIPVFRRSGHT